MAELTAEARARLEDARSRLMSDGGPFVKKRVVLDGDLREALATIDALAAEIARLRSRTEGGTDTAEGLAIRRIQSALDNGFFDSAKGLSSDIRCLLSLAALSQGGADG